MLSMFTKEATTLYRMIGGSMPQDNDVPKFSRGVSTWTKLRFREQKFCIRSRGHMDLGRAVSWIDRRIVSAINRTISSTVYEESDWRYHDKAWWLRERDSPIEKIRETEDANKNREKKKDIHSGRFLALSLKKTTARVTPLAPFLSPSFFLPSFLCLCFYYI